MFTGLIERVGRVAALDRGGRCAVLRIAHDAWDEPPARGDSVAVQGVCLTVVDRSAVGFACEVLEETLARTSLAEREPGAWVNLERAVRAADRLGGHFVTGHVDGIGRIVRIQRQSGDRVLRVRCEASLAKGLAPKGSVACDGVSLTVSALSGSEFEVCIIPHTWEHTSLRTAVPGDAVNIETDVLGKYVSRCMEAAQARGANVDMALLNRTGFA